MKLPYLMNRFYRFMRLATPETVKPPLRFLMVVMDFLTHHLNESVFLVWLVTMAAFIPHYGNALMVWDLSKPFAQTPTRHGSS